MGRQQLGQAHRVAACQTLQLGLATETVGQDYGLRVGRHRGPEVVFEDLHAHLVVADLDAEVPGQPAASSMLCASFSPPKLSFKQT